MATGLSSPGPAVFSACTVRSLYCFFSQKRRSLLSDSVFVLILYPSGSVVKNSPPMQEDALEEGTATHSSAPAWRVPRAEEPGGLPSTGSQSRTQLRAAPRSSAFELGSLRNGELWPQLIGEVCRWMVCFKDVSSVAAPVMCGSAS